MTRQNWFNINLKSTCLVALIVFHLDGITISSFDFGLDLMLVFNVNKELWSKYFFWSSLTP